MPGMLTGVSVVTASRVVERRPRNVTEMGLSTFRQRRDLVPQRGEVRIVRGEVAQALLYGQGDAEQRTGRIEAPRERVEAGQVVPGERSRARRPAASVDDGLDPGRQLGHRRSEPDPVRD